MRKGILNDSESQDVNVSAPVPCCENGCILTDAANGCSVAEGSGTTASGTSSHAEGSGTTASGAASHAEGRSTMASGADSHAEGRDTTASGLISHAEGDFTTASGGGSHSEGSATIASGTFSHAEGNGTRAIGVASHSEGEFLGATPTQAIGRASHAEGQATIANGVGSHTEGRNTTTGENAVAAHAEGFNTIANGSFSHSEGESTTASGGSSHAEGRGTTASGFVSHAEGSFTTASGIASHAEGSNTRASGERSHAEGRNTMASGGFSHAEGDGTVASGPASHAQGSNTRASGQHSHAEGLNTLASGFISHAQGRDTVANAPLSHVEGNNTSANGFTGVHIMGRFGDANELDFSWYLANGTGPANRGLAAKILRDGNVKIDGTVSSPAADYAEMFETVDGKPIDVGCFVTFDDESEKIRKASASDEYILGITSSTPSVLGNSGELRWKNKYITDEWGRVQYYEVVIPEERDNDGNVVIPEHIETHPILNPDWNPNKEYIPRIYRVEWVAVGLIGQILVRDDGTCKPGKYCRSNAEGIATASDSGYRVMKRIEKNQILVLLK
ncbi:hypothetical protein BTR23_16025 [Alkalihalophilus pseudofirmus]|nr:hypothetical protein BTR23_16025 [Alkalihalophilus pseudofirmus]